MSKNYTYYHDILLPVILGKPENIYLRSTNQKRLFARKRALYLNRAISKYSKIHVMYYGNTQVNTRKTTLFSLEIEFDHLVLSLRSSIEHLMQLINFVADLGLYPTSNDRKIAVNVNNVIEKLNTKTNKVLKKLGRYIKKEKSKNWYKTLHKLRIENYHNKFEKFINVDENIRLVLPDTKEIDLLIYCSTTIANVERLLSYGLKSLTEFLDLNQ